MIKKLLQKCAFLWSPEKAFVFSNRLKPSLGLISIIALTYGLIAGLFIAPADYQQGDAFRIIYIHVPFAMLSLGLYAAVGTLSLLYLIWRIKLADLLAYAIAPVGALCTLLALITGAIWGKPMWGTWWIWDARLTSELILLFLYLGYIGLYQALRESQDKPLAPSILAFIGLVDLPVIHYSVYWWHTLHQGATITRFAKPAMDSSMLYPLLAMILGLSCLSLLFCLFRFQAELLKRFENHEWVNQYA